MYNILKELNVEYMKIKPYYFLMENIFEVLENTEKKGENYII